eukprot:137123-Rhodomonas_salina.3
MPSTDLASAATHAAPYGPTSLLALTLGCGRRLFDRMLQMEKVEPAQGSCAYVYGALASVYCYFTSSFCLYSCYALCRTDHAYGATRYAVLTTRLAVRQLGYDRPSPKLLGFLRKHFNLSEYDPQPNNFVVYKVRRPFLGTRGF